MTTTPTSTRVDPVLRRALLAATRAPSPHNTQPWRFEVRPDRVDVRLDRTRVLPVADPDAHEARLSCGAALFNLRLALGAAGRRTTVAVLPDRADQDLLATVTTTARHRPTVDERTLAPAIERRHTNRRPFLDQPVPASTRAALVRAAAEEGTRLHLVDRPELLGPVADLIRRADHVQSQDSAFRAEVGSWLAGEGRPDGLPASALGRAPSPDGLIALRDFDPGGRHVAFERQPLIAVLTTVGDTVGDHVAAGQAMQRVLLVAGAAGLAVSFLSQPVEVPAVRRVLSAVMGGAVHVVLRIGFGYPGAPTPRRPLEDVTTVLADTGWAGAGR
ncbi:nitroreductase family protein [Actinokineospora sp. NBRC 105648]|uniref:Acg family FMN-binding oxidoreductase n=1 Tax=Actinokineospora sp. NBRC 105648 TaxID=3032206 RepID=UPI0024A2E2BB|nr:nitroreductase family protein [Actinokineospora sp. NBRC 105648]GLZ36681.1 hypothetical protein Acsp05_03060 [Actinokineospora sp. NBRC 105648]